LDLEGGTVSLKGPVRIRADVSRITNAVTVHLTMSGLMHAGCSRCLEGFGSDFKKKIDLNYPVDKSLPIIDLNPEIREEIIIDFPIKPLCKPDCKGLCVRCGKNLNEGKCNCERKA